MTAPRTVLTFSTELSQKESMQTSASLLSLSSNFVTYFIVHTPSYVTLRCIENLNGLYIVFYCSHSVYQVTTRRIIRLSTSVGLSQAHPNNDCDNNKYVPRTSASSTTLCLPYSVKCWWVKLFGEKSLYSCIWKASFVLLFIVSTIFGWLNFGKSIAKSPNSSMFFPTNILRYTVFPTHVHKNRIV